VKQVHLKKIRVVISLVFFLSLTYLFIDFRKQLPEAVYDAFTYLQFIPSFLNFISVLSVSVVGFAVVIVITTLFGRVYCSTICPLGTLMDIFSWIKRRIIKKSRFRYSDPVKYLRYSLLAITVVFYLFGSIFFLNLLDPFSIFGRIVSDFVQPGYIGLNNVGAGILEQVNIYFLFPEDISYAQVWSYFIPGLFLILILWLSLANGRIYCNTVCPVGTLLGLISRKSSFQIKMLEDQCTKCGKCMFACKSSCIRVKDLKVDFSRCVGCFNCISVCEDDAIKYVTYTRKKLSAPASDPDRRKTLATIGAMMLGLFGFRKSLKAQEVVIENEFPTEIEPVKHFTVTPPGSLGLQHFTDTCTACHLCVSACPTQVLQPSFLEYGLVGMMQPFMDYKTNYCNHECIICSEVCPTGAIMSLTVENKKTTQIGNVYFITENCVVYTDNTSCGSCSEHCPTQAVRMVPYYGELTIPEIRSELCVGCGACEHACPTKPYKAIFVDGQELHQVAQLPEEEELEQPDLEEDFPF